MKIDIFLAAGGLVALAALVALWWVVRKVQRKSRVYTTGSRSVSSAQKSRLLCA
jgi:hypothetical protein